MKIIIFGASGMVGSSVLREALQDKTIHEVLVINRKPLGMIHSKLSELVIPDLFDEQSIELRIPAKLNSDSGPT